MTERDKSAAPESGSPTASEREPIPADASEPALVLLGEAGLRAVECPTLQEAVLCVARLGEDDKPFARIKTAGGKVYKPHEIDRLYKAVPSEKIAADTARYEASMRRHRADLDEEEFGEAINDVARPKL